MSPLVSALVAAAALRGTIDASARTEVRGRNTNEGVAVFDLETALNLTFALRSRLWALTAGYGPHLLLRGDGGAAPDFLHGITLGAGYTGRRASFSLSEDGSYGRQSWAALVSDPTLALGSPRPDARSAALVIDYVSSRTSLLAKLAPARRWGLGLSLEYSLSGGADAASRAVIPFQTGPRGALSAEHALTRTDHLTSTIGASWTGFSTGPEDVILQATESWRHALGRTTEATLGGGAAWATSRAGASEPFRSQAYPIVEANIAHRIPSLRVDIRASGRVAPVVDRLSGSVDERLEATGAVTWRATRAISILGQAGVAQSISWDRPGAVTMVYHGLAVTYRINKIVQIDGGTRGFWWRARGQDAPPPQWVAFAGLTLTAPQITF